MADKIKFEWDGEQLKQTVEVTPQKFTPKEVIESLVQSKNNIGQMEEGLVKLENNVVKLKNDIKAGKEHLKRLEEFEPKCIKLMSEHLIVQIAKCSSKCIEEAKKETEKTIGDDPSAYTEDQKKNMNYVNYQRLLATDEKIARKISADMIREHIFMKPIFSNPFKG
jgi:dsDNA-specific endonuclease/ATPase MutS2